MSKELIEQGIEVLFRGGRKSFGPAGDQFLKTLSKKDKFNLKNLHKVNPEGFEGFGESVRRTYDGPQDQGAVDAGWNIIGTLDDLELKGKNAWEQQLNLESKNIPDNIEPEVEPKAYNLSKDVEDFMGDMDIESGRAWQQPGGELDVELEKLLTVGRGKKAKVLSYEELVERAKTSKADKTRLDYYNSLLATGPAQDADDILHYGFAEKPRAKTSLMEGSPEYSPQLHKSKEFHHKGMKSIQYGIFKRARQLVSEGKATTDDLLNLHALSNSMGAPSGSRKSAAEFMERFGHDVMHKQITLKKGVQPGGTRWTNEFRGGGKTKPKNITAKLWEPAKKAADDLGKDLTPFDIDYIKRQGEPLEKAIAKWKVFRKSKMYDALAPDGESEITRLLKKTDNMNIAELTQFQKEVLEDITLPMQEEAVLMEEVMGRLTPAQIFELQNTKDWKKVLTDRRTLKDQKAAKKEAKSAKAERKIESAIEHLN